MSPLDRIENKIGRSLRRMPNLMYILIGCYALGFILSLVAPNLLYFTCFDPYYIAHGQVWRLITWIIPYTGSVSGVGFYFEAVICFIYISIAKSLEQVVGRFRLNFYLILGLLMTMVMGTVYYFVGPLLLNFGGGVSSRTVLELYYIYMSPTYIYSMLFVLFALEFPDARFLLMFIIPVRGKWMVFITMAMYLVEVFTGFRSNVVYGWLLVFMILGAVIALVVYLQMTAYHPGARRKNRGPVNMNAYARKKKAEGAPAYRHKCDVCGRTDKTNPELEFRYCSKCSGNHEFCMEHLYTHVHVR